MRNAYGVFVRVRVCVDQSISGFFVDKPKSIKQNQRLELCETVSSASFVVFNIENPHLRNAKSQCDSMFCVTCDVMFT